MVPQENILLILHKDTDECRQLIHGLQSVKIGSQIHCVTSILELQDYLFRKGRYADPKLSPQPSLIIMDLNFSDPPYFHILTRIRQNEKLQYTPIIIMGNAQDQQDILTCYQAGAVSYIKKPFIFESLVEIMKALDDYWFSTVKLPLTETFTQDPIPIQPKGIVDPD